MLMSKELSLLRKAVEIIIFASFTLAKDWIARSHGLVTFTVIFKALGVLAIAALFWRDLCLLHFDLRPQIEISDRILAL